MYCVRCARKLPGEYNKCVKCRKDARDNAWYCPYCGSGVKKTAKSCDVCNAKLSLSPENYLYPPKGKQRKRKTAAILAFVLGFSGLHMLYLGFKDTFLKRGIWAAASASLSLLSLAFFRAVADIAFVNGYNAEILDEKLTTLIVLALCVAIGAVSLLIDWGFGIYDGVKMLINENYQDFDGQALE